MAETGPNGVASDVFMTDVEMKEEDVSTEAPLASIQQAAQDPTDPQPPPQPQAQPSLESVSVATPATINVAQVPQIAAIASAATPPSGSTPRPGSIPPQLNVRPDRPAAHGGPTRQFLNTNVTPHLLEGMKYIAVYEPEKPLLWLADFLRDRSKEVEGP